MHGQRRGRSEHAASARIARPGVRAWALLLFTAAGCASTRPGAAPAPFSSLLEARLAWDENGAPYYWVHFALPSQDLERVDSADDVLRLVVSAQVTTGSGKVLRSRVWTHQLARAALGTVAEHGGAFELGTVHGTQDLVLGILVQGQPYASPWRRRFQVPAPGPDALFLGEPVFLSCAVSATAPDSCTLRPQVGGYFDSQSGAPRFRCTVYDFAPRLQGATYDVAYGIRALEGGGETLALQGETSTPGERLATDVEVALPMLGLGRYGLEVRVRAGERSAAA